MIRERSALVYELLQLDDDSYALNEFVGNGLITDRFDAAADNTELFQAWSTAIVGLLREGYLTAFVDDKPTTDVSEEQLMAHYQHHLYDSQSRLEVMATEKGIELFNTLYPVMAAARPA